MAPKLGRREIYDRIIDCLNCEPWNKLATFKKRFYVTETNMEQRRILLDNGNGVVKYVSKDSLVSAIFAWTRDKRGGSVVYYLPVGACEELAKCWLHTTLPIDEPPAFRFASDRGLCFNRLAWDPVPGATPLFDEFLSRCSNAEALEAFIGSLFEPNADRQQYVWMHGMGANGKSTLLQFLRRIFGHACVSKKPPGRDDRFWASNLPGKRIVMLPDCNNRNFPASQDFKMLTGGDAVTIELKGENPFDAELCCKFIFASNDRPEITSQKADMRRAIYVEIKPIAGDPDPKYAERLNAEAPFIAHRCMKKYAELCPDHGQIPVDVEGLEMLAEQNEEEFATVFADNFKLVETDNQTQWKNKPWFSGAELQEVCWHQKWKKDEKSAFIKWLECRLGIKKRAVKIDPGKTRRVYVGAVVLPHSERGKHDELDLQPINLKDWQSRGC